MTRDPRLQKAGPLAGCLVAALALVGLCGCFNPFSPRIAPVRGVSSPPPVPNSAVEVVKLFAWCWNNRAYQEYTEIFTRDFYFQYTTTDSAGQVRGESYNRDVELQIASRLFVEGNAGAPPARSISLQLDPVLTDAADSRVGKDPKWHREVGTQVTLRIDTGEQVYDVLGRTRFYVIRGDSAQIPEELQNRFKPDSTRWWIEAWEDDTEGDASASRPRVEAGRAAPGMPGDWKLRPAAKPPPSPDGFGAPRSWSWARIKSIWR